MKLLRNSLVLAAIAFLTGCEGHLAPGENDEFLWLQIGTESSESCIIMAGRTTLPITFPSLSEAQYKSLEVSFSSEGWSAEISTPLFRDGLTCNEAAVTVFPPQASGIETTMTVTLRLNDGSSCSATRTLMSQERIFLVQEEHLRFSAGGGSLTISVESNAEWRIFGPEWLRIQPEYGDAGVSEVTITAAQNQEGRDRKCHLITEFPSFGTTDHPIEVHQYDSHKEYFNYETVDLGLSVMWASMNLGADYPEQYGDLYAWGEITVKDSYTESNSLTVGKAFLKDIAADPEHDAARAVIGGFWRMPTDKEVEELIEKCTHEYCVQCGVSGCRFTGPNGKSIFFPVGLDSNADYWTASPDIQHYKKYSKLLNLSVTSNAAFADIYNDGGRAYGYYVRPVISKVYAYPRNLDFEADPDKGQTFTIEALEDWHIMPASVPDWVGLSPYSGEAGKTKVIMNVDYNKVHCGRVDKIRIVTPSIDEYPIRVTQSCIPYDDGSMEMGLSVLWGTCNVGAASFEDFGGYYSWGETYTKGHYGTDNTDVMEKVLTDYSGSWQRDAATRNLGNGWRTPTKSEIEELINTCAFEWTTRNGVPGCKLTSPYGSYIFLPAAGSKWWYLDTKDVGAVGCIWSSTPYNNDNNDETTPNSHAYLLRFEENGCSISRDHYRMEGLSVRPVKDYKSPFN